jgi:cytochrome c oxidase subunit 2
MPLGLAVFIAFLASALGIIAVMLAVALSSRQRSEQVMVQKEGYALRRWWFFILAATIVASFIISLPSFPYPTRATASAGGPHYQVIARQYMFEVPASVPADTPLVFDVTSKDVNHGFGIYDPSGDLIAQVQAMPDYVNHLPFTFHRRGRYTIRCLEYCGVGHAVMQAGFEVR